MNSANEPADPIWSRVGPVLDEAMSRLDTRDRNALVLRFFEQKSFRTVGAVMGVSEEAARKRVDRALEKMRGFFAQRGLSFSAAVLSTALDIHHAEASLKDRQFTSDHDVATDATQGPRWVNKESADPLSV